MKRFTRWSHKPETAGSTPVTRNQKDIIMHFTCKTDFVGPFEPIWINHRWCYHGKTYRSLRNLKSRYSYKMECRVAKTLAEKLRKEIDKEIAKKILNTIYGVN